MSQRSDDVAFGLWNARLAAGIGDTVALLNAVSVAASAAIWTPAAGKRFRLTGFDLAGSVAGMYAFQDAVSGTVIYRTYLAANSPKVLMLPGDGILSAAINNALACVGPAASTLSGTLFGYEE